MGEILKKWVGVATGHIDQLVENGQLTEKLRTGFLFGVVLYNAGVIDKTQLHWLVIDDDAPTLTKNFQLLQTWLSLIHIFLTDREMDELVSGSVPVSISLLFHIYLKTINNFLPLFFGTGVRKKMEKLYDADHRFTVSKTRPEVDDAIGYHFSVDRNIKTFYEREYRVCNWLMVKNKGVEAKLTELNAKCKAGLKELYESFAKAELEEDLHINKNRITAPLRSQLLLEGNSEETRRKILLKTENAIFTVKLIDELIVKLLNGLRSVQDETFDALVTNKVLHVSRFETQMVQQLYLAFRMKEIISGNQEIYSQTVARNQQEMEVQTSMNVKDKVLVIFDIYCSEDNRNKEMHSKLNHQKVRLHYDRLYNYCMEIVEKIVEFALMNIAFVDVFECEPPDTQVMYWRLCFVADKPYRNYVDDLFKLTYYEDEEEQDMGVKEVTRLELNRQKAIARFLISDYVEERNIPFYNTRFEDKAGFEEIIDKTNTIIYKLLRRFKLSKYPKKELTKPDLPEFKVRCSIIGLTDMTILPILKTILKDSEVKIIEMSDAINYCIETYLKEDPYLTVEEEIIQANEETFDWIYVKNKNPVFKNRNEVWEFIQSHHHLPCRQLDEDGYCLYRSDMGTQLNGVDKDMLVLSETAQLGKIAFEFLYLGSQVPHQHVVQMFIQYLKTIPSSYGWILVNFPENAEQAMYLEEALTGVKSHVDPNKEDESSVTDIADVEMRALQVLSDIDPLEEKRKIFLFHASDDPNPPDANIESTLTTIIVMHPHDNSYLKTSSSFAINRNDTGDLENFYCTRGLIFAFHYRYLNYATIQELGKLLVKICMKEGASAMYIRRILGHSLHMMRESRATYNQIGGKAKKRYQRFDYATMPPATPLKPASKAASSKGDSDKKKDKKTQKKGGKQTKPATSTARQHDGTQMPEFEDSYMELHEELPVIVEPIRTKLSDQFQAMLASLYESVEEMVCKNLTSILFKYNALFEDEDAFILNNTKLVKDFLKEPHNKQQHLEEFQLEYNNLDDEYREDEEVKAEHFAKIYDLRMTLTRITDDFNNKRIEYLKNILLNEFIPQYVLTYANGHALMLQIELDSQRYLLQILNDYYVGVVTTMPCNRLLKSVKLKQFPEEMHGIFKKYLVRCLYGEEMPNKTNVLFSHLETNFSIAQALIEDYKTSCLGAAKEMENLYKAREKSNKFSPEAVAIFPDLLAEWKELIDGTLVKCSIKLLTVNKQSKNVVMGIFQKFCNMSAKLMGLIEKRYDDEIGAIDLACKALIDAVESETRIQPRLLLQDDQFQVNPYVEMYLDPLPPVDSTYVIMNPYLFSIKDLYKLIEIFHRVAPSGIMPERAFTFLLGDVVSFQTDIRVPNNWRKLNTAELINVTSLLFESSAYIDWRDFVLYNLNVPYPKMRDVFRAKRHFKRFDPNTIECIPAYHMCNVHLWFDSYDEDSDYRQMKNLFSKLFEVRQESVNYTMFLLAFCKDHNPILGFVKAVQFCLDAFVCTDPKEGAKYIKVAYGVESSHQAEESVMEVVKTENKKKVSVTLGPIVSGTTELEEHDSSLEIIQLLKPRVLLYGETEEGEEEDWEEINLMEEKESTEEESELSEEEESSSQMESIESCSCSQESYCEYREKVLMSSELLAYCDVAESVNAKIPTVHYIPYEILIKILSLILLTEETFKSTSETVKSEVKRIYNECKNPEYGDKVFTHQLFNHSKMKKIISSQYKFYQKNLERILNSALTHTKE